MHFGVLRCCTCLGAVAAAAVLAVAVSGCGESRAGAAEPPAVAVHERDFRIEAPARLKPGEYSLVVSNRGTTDHELIVAPLHGRALALRPDGLTVDEEAVEAQEPGSLEPGHPGAKRRLTLHLAAGRYVFFCNMEGHYMAGMHSEVVVG